MSWAWAFWALTSEAGISMASIEVDDGIEARRDSGAVEPKIVEDERDQSVVLGPMETLE